MRSDQGQPMTHQPSIAQCRQAIEHLIAATEADQQGIVTAAARHGVAILAHLEKRAALYRECERLHREAPAVLQALLAFPGAKIGAVNWTDEAIRQEFGRVEAFYEGAPDAALQAAKLAIERVMTRRGLQGVSNVFEISDEAA